MIKYKKKRAPIDEFIVHCSWFISGASIVGNDFAGANRHSATHHCVARRCMLIPSAFGRISQTCCCTGERHSDVCRTEGESQSRQSGCRHQTCTHQLSCNQQIRLFVVRFFVLIKTTTIGCHRRRSGDIETTEAERASDRWRCHSTTSTRLCYFGKKKKKTLRFICMLLFERIVNSIQKHNRTVCLGNSTQIGWRCDKSQGIA
jgi:hypothetical protein